MKEQIPPWTSEDLVKTRQEEITQEDERLSRLYDVFAHLEAYECDCFLISEIEYQKLLKH